MTFAPSLPRFVRNPNLIAAEVDGDLMMMSVEHGEYFGITGVGARIWEVLASPSSVAEIALAICSEYAVEEAICQAETQAFLEELVRLRLVSAV